MRILVIGGAGFVGCNLALYLQSRGHSISVMDNLYRRGSELNLKEINRRAIPFYYSDIRRADGFENLPSHDFVLLTAAQSSAIDGFQNALYDVQTNFQGVVNVLQFARKTGAGVIFFSTNKVYDAVSINALPYVESSARYDWLPQGNQETAGFDGSKGISEEFRSDGDCHGIYGLSKVCGDLACREWFHSFGVKTVVNRCSCIAGPRQFGAEAQGWLAWWVIAAMLDLPLTYFGWGGRQVRDVLFIQDVCLLIERQISCFENIAGQVFNIGGGMRNSLSLLEATAMLESKFKKRLITRHEPRQRLADHRIYVTDSSKSQRLLDWSPRAGLDEGVDLLIEWALSQRDELAALNSAA
jgi:CDP-paratose 2-epimerase